MSNPSTQYSVSWNDHIRSISNGLSSLQQNAEFVDMTLAADGHFVKVHKVVMALASPYIKEIISSMKCDHPVIFLNKVSFITLISILEYVYTGEVYIQSENIDDFIAAACDLHIKGLKDINFCNNRTDNKIKTVKTDLENSDESYGFEEQYCEEVTMTDVDIKRQNKKPSRTTLDSNVKDLNIGKTTNFNIEDSTFNSSVHYTKSNRGSLQMILNKMMYYLKHSNKDGSRQWRCVDYLNKNKCPALTFTKDDLVIQRVFRHNHEDHKQKITKRLRSGNVYTAVHEAEKKSVLIESKNEDSN